MSISILNDLKVMENLQKAYNGAKDRDVDEASKIFFSYYDLDYEKIEKLPHDLKVSLDTLQKQGYLNHNHRNLFINNIRISKYIITLTTEGERYFSNKFSNILTSLINKI